MGDINEVFHLFRNILVLRDILLINIKFKTSVKIKSHLFKKTPEILSVTSDVFRLIFHSSLNIPIFLCSLNN